MRCHSCEDKKSPADCLVSLQFNLEQFDLDMNQIGSVYDFYKFRSLHKRSQLSCLADCFLMDGNWCNSHLPESDRNDYGTELWSNEYIHDASGILYDTAAQTRFLKRALQNFQNFY